MEYFVCCKMCITDMMGQSRPPLLSWGDYRSMATVPGHLTHLTKLLLLTVLFLAYPSYVKANIDHRDYPPTMFYQQPISGSPKAIGSLKLLQCYANGDPSPRYWWLKDGEYIRRNLSDTTLRLDNIQRDDAGIYQCVSQNSHGALLSDRVQIHVAYMLPFVYTGNKDLAVDQGQAQIIDLPALSSYPAPTITWDVWADGNWERIPAEGQRYHMTLAKQLVILETKLSSDNNKMFRARALLTQTGEESESQTFVLKVRSIGSLTNNIPPQIVVPPSDTTAVQGDDAVVLECVANARPLNYLSLKWYRQASDGSRTLIQPDNAKYLLPMYRRRLTILNPLTDDSGAYVCEAAFSRPGAPELPTAEAVAQLIVQVKPSFVTPPPAEIQQDVGTTVIIPCIVNGLPSPTVRWSKNGTPINLTATAQTSTHMTILSNGNLQIASASAPDSGMFQCFAVNQAGEINRATWVTVMSFPPEIVVPPRNLTVIEGDLARFPCSVDGAPQPNIRWYRVTIGDSDEEELPGNNDRIQLIDGAIIISVTIVEDSGVYVCNATNALGYAAAEAWLRVMVRTKIASPPQDAEVIKGSTTVLQCGVHNDPNVTVHWLWYHNNAQIDPTTDSRRQIREDGSLEITHVRNDDIGIYRCRVVSSGGNDTAQANVTVIEIPHTPFITNVQLNTVNMKAVDVFWSQGFDGNSPILMYTMEFRMVPPGLQLLPDEGWIEASDSIPPSSTRYTVTGLFPSRSYQFRVAAANAVGMGQPSIPSNVIEIPQQPPSGPPRGVFASPRSNSSIVLQWQPPEEEQWNGPLLGYRIRLKPAGYGDETLQFKNITNYLITMDELTGLIVWTEYKVAVAAYNKKGVGVYCDYVDVRTLEGRPTAAPKNPQTSAQNSTAIKVTWMPPDSQFINGINLGYKIHANIVENPEELVEVIVPSNISNMLGLQTGYLTDLMKYTEYRITVLCFTSQGGGPTTGAVQERTLQDVPDAVASLTFDNILDTSLRVLWEPPININGILTGYTLTYQVKAEPISKVTEELGPSTHNYTVEGLTATTVYVIEVYATTSVGPGPPTATEIESGIPPVRPSPPTSVVHTNIKATQVLLQFAPGFSGHTSISRWVVEEQRGAETADWSFVYEETAPEATSLTVTGLRPYTDYRLRMLAENIAGISDPSEPTSWFQTWQAEPDHAPRDVTMRAVNETALRVGWTPLQPGEWNGEPKGYQISYRPPWAAENDTSVVDVLDPTANSHMITRLQEWTQYEVRVAAHNALGAGPYSGPETDRTWEAAPSAGPEDVTADALSSTSIKVSWSNVTALDQNGPILGYKVEYRSDEEMIAPVLRIVNSTTAREVTLTNLRKFVFYEIKVLAYTRIGDGVFSQPERRVQTFQDVPGPPCCIYFPEVTHTTAKIMWGRPAEPNGIISGYRVGYRMSQQSVDEEILDTVSDASTSYSVEGLQRNVYYTFSVTAETAAQGWGARNELQVYTIINRRRPDAPTQPQIVDPQVGDRQVTINWQPTSDGFGPIRNYSAQVQKEDQAWVDVGVTIPHNATSYTVTGLSPYTQYRFRVAANNDIGRSNYSVPSRQVLTKQDAPESPPLNLKVAPQTRTSVFVSWEIPPVQTWNGHLSGYQIDYKESDKNAAGGAQTWITDKFYTPDLESKTIENLQLFVTYDLHIRAFNMFGHSAWSPVVTVYLEMVPMESPQNVRADTLSSTDILVFWEPPPLESQNGDLKGYKVYSWLSSQDPDTAVMRQVGAGDTSLTMTSLEMYTEYSVVMAAYNAAGDGPNNTQAATNRTAEGVPGVPGALFFVVISLSQINVSWASPARPNGVIQKYEVSYKEVSPDEESRHVQEILPGDQHSYIARDLRENIQYQFSVRARTIVDWGSATARNITIGAQPGSPGQPGKPELTKEENAVLLTWTAGVDGLTNVTSHIIQAKERAASAWDTMTNTNSAAPSARVPYVDLKPMTEYQFRVIAVNAMGISNPSEASEYLRSWEVEGKQEPFHKKWWFLVIIALIGVIIIILVTFLLCLLGRRKRGPAKYKGQQTVRAPPFPPGTQASSMPRTIVQLSDRGSLPDEDGGFAAELENRSVRQSTRSRRSQRSARSARSTTREPIRNTLYRNGAIGGAAYAKSPPRPSPGSVNYSDEDYKKYVEDDDSSTTDKPSDYSSSGGSQASDSEPDEKDLPPPPFPPQYTSNGDVRHSWKGYGHPSNSQHHGNSTSQYHSNNHLGNGSHRGSNNHLGANLHKSQPQIPQPQIPQPQVPQPETNGGSSPYDSFNTYNNAYNYTDSEQDSTTYAMSMNGGHVIMNNMARSRAPLPGFSSFV